MAVVAPFRGVRFNPARVGRLADVVTPPYDVISSQDGARFLAKNPYNMIRLDLRNTSQQVAAEPGRYQEARQLFTQWQQQGVLIQDDQPALYLYTIQYQHPSGVRRVRTGCIALVELADFSEGIVKPHEKTFDGVVADRLELMDTCGAQFSQVFSLYRDPEQEVIAALTRGRQEEPCCSLEDPAGNVHTLWRVVDEETHRQVGCFFQGRSLYIADGHHRYTTALQCRERARQRHPDLPADAPVNFIMMYLCASEDEGLSVLPTHRLVHWPGRMRGDELEQRMRRGMAVEEIREGRREDLIAALLSRMEEAQRLASRPTFGAYHPGEDRGFLLQFREDIVKWPGLARQPSSLQELDVVVLSEVVIHGLLDLDRDRCLREHMINYISDPDEALDVAVKQSVQDDSQTPLLFLLNATRVEQVLRVADQGEVMPHKSTYFYPKILTGLLINKIYGNDHIRIPGPCGQPGHAV